MSEINFSHLTDRSVIAVTGPDRKDFLQGLVTNDVMKVSDKKTIWSAFLTPQGKFLYDFFIAEEKETLLIDCLQENTQDILKKLRLYKLRSQVELHDLSNEWQVFAFWSEENMKVEEGQTEQKEEGVFYIDPRLSSLGKRAFIRQDKVPHIESNQNFMKKSLTGYHAFRIETGVTDASDMISAKSIIMENNFDELNAIDWDKGCYLGQELISRIKHRGLVRKRLLPFRYEQGEIKIDDVVTLGEREVGVVRNITSNHGLAIIRLEIFDDNQDVDVIKVNGVDIKPLFPAWLHLS